MSQAHRSNDHDSGDTRELVRAWLGVAKSLTSGAGDDAMTALAIAVALWLLTVVAPRVDDLQVNAQASYAQRMQELDRAYCEQWGVAPASRNFARCVQDLERLRARELDIRIQRLAPM